MITLNDVFKVDGILKTRFPDYEIRDSQVKMATLVQRAMRNKISAVIEGATGVGKGFAYLIPAIVENKQIVVSTSNKSLQDQLHDKDLPLLKIAFNLPFTWTVLKGKNNYFCYERYFTNEQEVIMALTKGSIDFPAMTFNEAQVFYESIEKWAQSQDATKRQFGDLEYMDIKVPPKVRELIGCDNQMKHEKDSKFESLCFASLARKRAKEAQIVLVNHTLLSLDIALRRDTGGVVGILPDTKYVVIDEAHMFEKAAVLAFSDEISMMSLYHLLNWSIVKKAITGDDYKMIVDRLKTALEAWLPEQGNTGYYQQKKVLKFDNLQPVINALDIVIHKIDSLEDKEDTESASNKKEEVLKEANNLKSRLSALMATDENMLRWSEAREGRKGDPFIKLKSVPLDISPLLKTGLFDVKTVICCSATLSVRGKFDFFKEQVGMGKDTLDLIVPSPFDYKKQALVFISSEDNKVQEMEQLISMSKGNAFILFTSYKDMQNCYSEVRTKYPKLIQNSGVTRVQLLEEFKNTPGAVLFATKTFWEGVDIKGDKLRLVIIHKIPFENPYDLVFSSKCEKIDNKYGKGQSFIRLSIPDACIKLKQGVGRLIRSTTDTGVIALLDARVNYKSYGSIIVESLPPAYRTQKMEKVKSFFDKINGQLK